MFQWSFKKRCVLTFIGFLLTFIPLLFPPGPLLVSEATTRIVGPVDESGKLRFRQYFNQAYDQVRPEDNGYELLADPPLPVDQDTWYLHPMHLNKTPSEFVLAWCNRVLTGQAGYWGDDQLPPPEYAPVNDLVRPYFEELLGKPWAEHKPGRFDHHLLAAQLSYAMEHPWKKKDFPVLANFIQFNKQIVMDALLQSAECHTYIPHVRLRDPQSWRFSSYYPATEDSLVNQGEDGESRFQNLGLALQIHTTLMIGEGKTSSWINQLGRLHTSIRQQSTTGKREFVNIRHRDKETSMLAAYATILRHAGTDPQICQQLTEILNALPPALTETEYVDQVLRYYVLDFVQETKQFGTAPYWNIAVDREISLNTPPLFLALGSMMTAFTDWDKETIHIHQWMDSLAETVREPDAETRSEAVQTWVAKVIRADMGLATRACLMTYLKLYLLSDHHQIELLLRDRMVLLRQQIAIERHRQRTGVYPNQLDQVEGIALNHGDPFPMSYYNLFFRGNDAGYMLGLSCNDLWENAFPTAPLFHPQGHDFCRAHLSELHFNWFLEPFHIGGEAYELLRLSDEEVIAEHEREREILQLGDEDEDVDLIEQRRQIGLINELQQAGVRFFEAPWLYVINESSTFTPILVWFSAAEENAFNDRLIPTLANLMAEQTSIHIVNLNETQVTSAGLIQLLELIAAAEDTDRDKPVTIECAAINEQVISRFKVLQSSQIELQLPEGELLTTAKESLIDY